MTSTIRKHSSHHNPKGTATFDQTATQSDIYARITGKILMDIENGNLTWRKPWHADHMAGQVMRPLRWNDVPYTGINTLMLWGTAAEQGFSSPYWMTFRQASELKANVRKGEKGTQVVYADKFTKEEQDAKGETVTSQIPFLKSYTVFNANQIDGLSDAFYKHPDPVIVNPLSRNEALESFFAQTKADIHTGREAAYSITTDRVQMPPFESFESVAS
ncbi:MAG: DUF1738 domain-containing protein, partial [Proteobacteria bacterium]